MFKEGRLFFTVCPLSFTFTSTFHFPSLFLFLFPFLPSHSSISFASSSFLFLFHPPHSPPSFSRLVFGIISIILVLFQNAWSEFNIYKCLTVNCLRKIQLAFDHVLAPLKSELNFNKPLVANDLTKHNSLLTFVFWRPGKQLLCRGNAGEDGVVDESDFSGKFSTPRPAFLSGAADNQQLAKTGMDLGAL